LTSDEMEDMDLGDEQAEAPRQGLEFLSFPIPDRNVPESYGPSTSVFRQLGIRLNDGCYIGIHCRQGIGRSSLLAATLLVLAGIDSEVAWRRVEAARGLSRSRYRGAKSLGRSIHTSHNGKRIGRRAGR
jgi:protein-tyrosine phosphatase